MRFATGKPESSIDCQITSPRIKRIYGTIKEEAVKIDAAMIEIVKYSENVFGNIKRIPLTIILIRYIRASRKRIAKILASMRRNMADIFPKNTDSTVSEFPPTFIPINERSMTAAYPRIPTHPTIIDEVRISTAPSKINTKKPMINKGARNVGHSIKKNAINAKINEIDQNTATPMLEINQKKNAHITLAKSIIRKIGKNKST
jgi:hypothetical protein